MLLRIELLSLCIKTDTTVWYVTDLNKSLFAVERLRPLLSEVVAHCTVIFWTLAISELEGKSSDKLHAARLEVSAPALNHNPYEKDLISKIFIHQKIVKKDDFEGTRFLK